MYTCMRHVACVETNSSESLAINLAGAESFAHVCTTQFT